ncbi:unnamed protein product [Linum tenue]|uniref:Uncharacterized protein n=1 Tax=Linum tenue TaxID=586396 RepID=A0AAV0LEA6_9ROSI|nr:unnamed protein product [Linum tenue]CAI0432139.1 unnamed protein product [Linum tenue]
MMCTRSWKTCNEAAMEALEGVFSTMSIEDNSVEGAEPGGPGMVFMRSPFGHED